MVSRAFYGGFDRFTDRTKGNLNAAGDYESFINTLGSDHRERINRYKLYWDFYEGVQWSGQKIDSNLSIGLDENATLNYCRRLVNTNASFLMRNDFEISIPELADEGGTSQPELRQFIKNVLDDTWEKNSKDTWSKELIQSGAVSGDAFIRISWSSGDVFTDAHAKLEILPPVWVFPTYNSVSPDLMDNCIIAYPVEETEIVMSGLMRRTPTERTVVRLYKEEWTDTTVTKTIGKEVISEEAHNLGFIPIVHIQNYPNANNNYGISDLADIINVQRLLNEKISDISDVIKYHGSPITILSGARAEGLQRGAQDLWELPAGAEVKNLELSGDLGANINFASILRSALMDISATPEQAINPTKNVSNTPGVALHMMYMPMEQLRATKIGLYGRGIKRANAMVLKYHEKMDPAFARKMAKIKTKAKYATDVSFGESLPRDESLALSTNQQKLDMGITSRKQILMEAGYGASDAERIIKEADEDSMLRAELLAKSKESETGGTFGKPAKPDPVVQGDKVSNQKPG